MSLTDTMPEPESVLFPKKKAKATSKVSLIKAFAEQLASLEADKAESFLAVLRGGEFNTDDLNEYPSCLEVLQDFYRGIHEERAEMPPAAELLSVLWKATVADDNYDEVEDPYITWISCGMLSEADEPEGWPGWMPGLPLESQPALSVKTVRAKRVALPDDAEGAKALKPKKEPKPKKEKPSPKTLREAFEEKLEKLDRGTLIRPWMASKALRLVQSPAELEAWVARTLADKSLYRQVPRTDEWMPAVAVDTENYGVNGGASGLDTRMVNGEPQAAIAGICLSADGIEGLYVPLSHEDGKNLDPDVVRSILQPFFNKCLLRFFNGKYDREILMFAQFGGYTFRPYPYWEDAQIDHFLIDPKSEVDEDTGSFESAGLKALSERELGIDQIELDEIAKVKIRAVNPKTGKTGYRMVLAPFNWIPTELAVLYAGADGITTWLLCEKMHEDAIKMRYVHKIDHELADALGWVERQRPLIDVAALNKTVAWHREKLDQYKAELCEIVGNPDFNPGSNEQLARVLFEQLKLPVVKRSGKTGAPSADADVIEELLKRDKNHPFLTTLVKFREYSALHPDHLRYDPRDHTAKLLFKQCTVAGGRLAAEGGTFFKDGGFGLNPQAIVSVGGNLWINARRLRLEDLPDLGETFDPYTVTALELDDLDPSCREKDKETRELKGLAVKRVVKQHIARYCGEWWSLAKDKPCLLEDGTEIPLDKATKVDANEVVNLRSMFIAPEGYTYFTVDYSNIEMRVAANVSGEPKFIDEFLYGTGDFHTLTAKNVFPEFSDPNVSKARKKELRSLAKIINFALLYGGTEHTIYENMKATDPTITKEKAAEMVRRYWEGVPKFAEWAQMMQGIAREKMICKTKSGRIIDFNSAMRSQKLYKPLDEHYGNYRAFWQLKRKAEELMKAKRKEEADKLLAQAQAMYMDKSTGVANVGDYKKFIGKIQRVSVNAPLQGLAGDFMRAALGFIYRWATRVGLGDILLCHATVHDEVDFSVKNEYVPFVLPRLVRLMKLREMHKAMKWPVPIETDCEYGKSWDVKEHLTGDDGHNPAGYTKVPGLEKYIPPVFDPETVKALVVALRSNDLEAKEEVYAYLKATVHPRVHVNIPKLKDMDIKDAIQALIAILQLHEYWTIEEQDEFDPNEETLVNYQRRMGLAEGEPVQRPVIRHEIPEVQEVKQEAPLNEQKGPFVKQEGPEVQQEASADETPAEDFPAPKVEVNLVPKLIGGIPQLRDLSMAEVAAIRPALGAGGRTIQVYLFTGELIRIDKVGSTEIPHEFLVMEESPVDVPS